MISKAWNQLAHAKKWILFSQNWRAFINRLKLFLMELNTFITNKSAKGRKVTIATMAARTKADAVVAVI